MIGVHSIGRIFLCTQPTDMRKSFDGLCGEVERVFDQDPLNGNLFVFFNRKCTMVKMLLWDRYGFWVCAKRLQSGTFSLRSIEQSGETDITNLQCILDGLEITKSWRRKRFLLEKNQKSLCKN